MKTTKETYNLSKQIFLSAKEEFNIRTLLYSELLEKEKTVINAQTNYINAVYNYFVAKLNYDVAKGVY
ncbi:TolC family protein [Aquimarina addita]|uniref:TolC family protein n=1 Tax=Aquimarina addita TaxID=870485 RepID=UPI003CD0A211